MWVRYYDDANPIRRRMWGYKQFESLEDATCGELEFEMVNDGYYRATSESGVMVKVLYEFAF